MKSIESIESEKSEILNHFDDIFETNVKEHLQEDMPMLNYLFQKFSEDMYTTSPEYKKINKGLVKASNDLHSILNKEQESLAYEFAKESNLKVGFQRIDFLKLENDELILLEIEDNSPHMNLEELTDSFRKTVLLEYKNNIYKYIQK